MNADRHPLDFLTAEEIGFLAGFLLRRRQAFAMHLVQECRFKGQVGAMDYAEQLQKRFARLAESKSARPRRDVQLLRHNPAPV